METIKEANLNNFELAKLRVRKWFEPRSNIQKVLQVLSYVATQLLWCNKN